MLNFIRGFCMALADSVPGVSGGTVAFLLGFYDKFIMSLDHLMSGTKEERIEAIKFLIRIGIGWVVGMGAAVSVLASIFDDRIYEISSLFLGLIIFAIPMICKEEKDSLKGKYQNIIWAVIGVVLVAAITYFNPVSGKGISVSVEHLNIALAVYIFAGLDAMEERLADKRFLFGDYVTDSDIRLYTTIARLDVSYSRNIGPCKHRLVDYPNLWGYARDLYQIPAFRHNTYFKDFAAS